jgi:hypothetical protein
MALMIESMINQLLLDEFPYLFHNKTIYYLVKFHQKDINRNTFFHMNDQIYESNSFYPEIDEETK